MTLSNTHTILHYNGDNNCFFNNGKTFSKFKTDIKNVDFLTQFYVGAIPIKFGATASREVFLKNNVYDFSFDWSTINYSDILTIY